MKRENEQQFINYVEAKKVPHAFIISGVKGVGKREFVFKAAKYLLFKKDSEQSNMLFSGEDGRFLPSLTDEEAEFGIEHPDLMHISLEKINEEEKTPKRHINIDQIKTVEGFLRKTSYSSSWKIVIVDSADDLNVNAANALLKILEEPPENCLLFLISSSPLRLLPTIRSRCRFINMLPDSENEVREHLEQGNLESSEIDFITKMSGGAKKYADYLIKNSAYNFYQDFLSFLENVIKKKGVDKVKLDQLVIDKNKELLSVLFDFFISELIKIKAGLSDSYHPVLQIISDKNGLEDLLNIKAESAKIFNRDKALYFLEEDTFFYLLTNLTRSL